MNCVAQAELYDYSYRGCKYRLYLHRLGGNLFLEIQAYANQGQGASQEEGGCIIDLGAGPKQKAEWHTNRPQAQGEAGLWLPKIEPGDSIILDKPGAAAVKAVTAGDQVYKEIEKKKVSIVEKSCTCPIFELIAGGCTCGGFKAEKAGAKA